VIFHATVAHPDADRERAVDVLRNELRAFTAAASAGTPDWRSLVIEGPTVVSGYRGDALHVWTATVATTIGHRALS
jgi:hypothetical protein